MPSETLLPSTVQWISTLPSDVQPTTIAKTFPGIANALAVHWTGRDALASYVKQLMVNNQTVRRHPIRVARELRALRSYHATVHRDRDNDLGRLEQR